MLDQRYKAQSHVSSNRTTSAASFADFRTPLGGSRTKTIFYSPYFPARQRDASINQEPVRTDLLPIE
jgi:hypothetical protein